MMKYKALVLDLDGTLLNSKKEIGARTKEYLKSIANDIKIIYASARQFWRIQPYLKEIELLSADNYTICLNGAIIVDNLENTLFALPIEKEVVFNVEKIILNSNLKWTIYGSEIKINYLKIENKEDFFQQHDVYKIVAEGTDQQIKQLRELLPQYCYENLAITSSESTRIEMVNKKVNKVDAIKKVIDTLGINKDEIIAIGDGENDIAMIQYAGCGIAMKNANAMVQKSADIVTEEDNDHDGIVTTLKKIL